MPHVAFLLHPRALLAGLTAPAEMLRAADEVRCIRERASPSLRISVATTDDRPVTWLSVVTVAPNRSLQSLLAGASGSRPDPVDLVYVPPPWRKPSDPQPEAVSTLARLADDGTLICAMSTGAYLLAQAGLLDGRAATTHWSFLDDFARRYPRVELKREHLITRSGNLYCAGSLNATGDLTAHFIEHFYGTDIARRVEAQFSPEIRRPASQLGYFDEQLSAQPDELMAEAQHWLRERLGEPVEVADLSRHLGISRRSLNRRFREATGRTPVRFLQEARVEEASALLRNTNLAVREIGERVGYYNASHFATLFRRLTSQSPSSYRAAVRAKLFTLE
jgi:transcriptional regulator GlxA family with amidase domain